MAAFSHLARLARRLPPAAAAPPPRDGACAAPAVRRWRVRSERAGRQVGVVGTSVAAVARAAAGALGLGLGGGGGAEGAGAHAGLTLVLPDGETEVGDDAYLLALPDHQLLLLR